MKSIGNARLACLRNYTTPTVANAIEVFKLRARNEGYMRPEIRCIFPALGVMVGHAVTIKIRAARPPAEASALQHSLHWEKLLETPPPRVVVAEDLDDPPGAGSFWGEVNANIHRALSCVGVVTNGSVRDLTEVEALGFHFFAAHVSVSHAYVHIVEVGTPVIVGGLTVCPADVLHGDRHGVLHIPFDAADRIPEGVQQVEAMERKIINYTQSPGFSLEGLKNLWAQLRG